MRWASSSPGSRPSAAARCASNEVSSAFCDHRPYALCAFAGGWVVVGARLLFDPGNGEFGAPDAPLGAEPEAC